MSTGDHGLSDRDGNMIRKGRVSPALKTAVTLIVHEGLTVADAAKRTGYKTESLAKALLKPHVKAFRSDVKRAWLASKTDQAYITVANLATSANSEDVMLKAAKVLIDMDQAARNAMPEQARQLVQIVTGSVTVATQLISSQPSGVIEAQPWRAIEDNTSNSDTVGRGEIEGDDDDA